MAKSRSHVPCWLTCSSEADNRPAQPMPAERASKMSGKVLIATTGRGIGRAALNDSGRWSVDFLLHDVAVNCLAADALNPTIIYAGTKGNGVLRSDDRGHTWQPAGMDRHDVKALAVSPSEPNVIYAGTKPACMFVSHNAGKTWEELESFRRIPGRRLWFSPAQPPFTAYVQGIALSPADRNVLVVGIEFGAVVRSADGGSTWTGHRKGALRDCHTITFHTSNGNWVYEAGGTGAGAAVSQNAGESWVQPRAGLDRHYGWACAADPMKPSIWYVSASPMPKGFGPPPAHIDGKANAGIYRMQDGQWQMLAGGLPQPLNFMAYALVTDPERPGHLYAGMSNGDVWHTTDYGEVWNQLPVKFREIRRTMILV